jgi:hypothetical protein
MGIIKRSVEYGNANFGEGAKRFIQEDKAS